MAAVRFDHCDGDPHAFTAGLLRRGKGQWKNVVSVAGKTVR
jgi:hypothetical protein